MRSCSSVQFQALIVMLEHFKCDELTRVPCQSLLKFEAPQKGGGRWGGAAQKFSATFTLKKWSKTTNFSSNWHGALVNSSHLKCSSALTNIQNSYLVY